MRKLLWRLWRIAWRMACLVVVLYLAVVVMVVVKANNVPLMADYDAIVVLGAQVKRDGSLSIQLQWRLDAAFQAWQQHPVPVVTCGAQGRDEPAPEGDVMRDYLIGRGIPADQVFSDPDSHNTRENIAHAKAILDGKGVGKVLIVTSDYHLPRAMALAADVGWHASGLGADTKPEYWVKNYGREALSWIKYWGQKYLHLNLD